MSEPEAPTPLAAHAAQQLRFIRNTMNDTVQFTAVPGWGMCLMGASALLTAFLAEGLPIAGQLQLWWWDAALAGSVGVAALWQKTCRLRVPLMLGPGRKFLLAILPAGLFSVALASAAQLHNANALVPSVWLGGYGLGVLAAGVHSVAPVPLLGAAFLLCALATLMLPIEAANTVLGLAFGGLHVLFGLWIARRYGG